MGDIADMMLDGTLCSRCGGFISEKNVKNPPGVPVICRDCQEDEE